MLSPPRRKEYVTVRLFPAEHHPTYLVQHRQQVCAQKYDFFQGKETQIVFFVSFFDITLHLENPVPMLFCFYLSNVGISAHVT